LQIPYAQVLCHPRGIVQKIYLVDNYGVAC
jgi:hypothetical protein